MKETKLDKVFNYGIGCIGLIGILSTVIALLIAITQPTLVIAVLQDVAGLTSTPVVILVTSETGPANIPAQLPTYTPPPTYTSLPTYTPFPTYTLPPLPSMTPTPSLSLPFQDNFDTGISPNWQTLTGTWRMVNGQLTADPSDELSILLIGDESWSDYVVDVDVFNYNWNYPVGIIVRAKSGNYLLLQTNCCNTDWILVMGVSERIIAHLDEGGLSSSGFNGFAKNHFRVEAIGQTFTVYIDGKLYLQVQDPTLTSGKVGLAFQYPFENTVRFDNFRVTSP